MDFVIYVSEICHFLCLSLMRSFLVQVFSIFDHSVWLVLSIRCAHFCSFNFFTGVVVVALANLSWSVFVSIKLSQTGSYH